MLESKKKMVNDRREEIEELQAIDMYSIIMNIYETYNKITYHSVAQNDDQRQ